MLRSKIFVCWLILLPFLALSVKTIAQQRYNRLFNPMRGFVIDVEKPFREELCLNGKWQFMPVYDTVAKFVKPESFQCDGTIYWYASAAIPNCADGRQESV